MTRLLQLVLGVVLLMEMSCASTVQSNWSCPLEKGGRCQSTREIDNPVAVEYARRAEPGGVSISGAVAAQLWGTGGWTAGPVSGAPLREPDPVVAVAIAPWVDAGGDYHAGSRVLAVMRRGGWYLSPAPPLVQLAPPPAAAPTAPPPMVDKPGDGAAEKRARSMTGPQAGPQSGPDAGSGEAPRDLFTPVEPPRPMGDRPASRPDERQAAADPAPGPQAIPDLQGQDAPVSQSVRTAPRRGLARALYAFLGRITGIGHRAAGADRDLARAPSPSAAIAATAAPAGAANVQADAQIGAEISMSPGASPPAHGPQPPTSPHTTSPPQGPVPGAPAAVAMSLA